MEFSVIDISFKHAQSKDRRGGIRWRLDLLALVKYFESKSFVNRATERGVFERLRELKWRQILMTIASLERLMDEMDVGSEPEIETLGSCYETISHSLVLMGYPDWDYHPINGAIRYK